MDELSPAQRLYEHQKRNVIKYQQRYPEKTNEKMKRYMKKMKAERPERYEMILQ